MAGSGGTLTWSTTSVTLAVGETITVNYTTTFSEVQSANFTSLIASVATFTEGTNKINLTGTAAGTVTIAANTTVGFETVTTNALTITVTSADDQNFLNERGLAHFWENVDDVKQNKLTAGAGILITNDVISATGGGTADAVDWGHITGSMSNQTDLTTALNAKANTADLATVATSGDYDDLTDKPTIGNATLTIQKNGTSAGTFTANATSNKTINITVPTTAADVSALPASTKYGASIAVSINTTDYKVTTTLKDQDGNTLGTAQVIDLPLESVVVNGSYDNTNKKIILTLQNGNTIDIPVADLVAGLQSEITSSNKLSSDLVDDTNHTHKFVTAAQITKLNGIAAGAEVNVQSDWDQTTTTADDYIKNKPSLATVATSGSYNDLSDKPTIQAKQVFYGTSDSSGSLSSRAVACSGFTYAEGNVIYVTFSNADTYSGGSSMTMNVNSTGEKIIFTQTTSGGGIQSDHKWAAGETVCFVCHDDRYLMVEAAMATTTTAGLMSVGDKNKLNGIAAGAEVNVQANWTESDSSSDAYIQNKPSLATVATSGSYNDLSNKPTIPTVNNATLTIQKNGTTVNTFTANASSNVTANITVPINVSDLTNDAGYLTSVAWGDVTGKPTFATVATSGSYNDLSNKPTIPTVNDATLTIQKNGADVQTFTANQSTNATANITVPTKTSDLTNDGADNTSTYVEADELATVATTGDYSDLTGTPTIPTVNDATLTIEQKDAILGTFTANASSAKTINITAPYCDGLYGQAQTAAYHRSVIALCEVSTTAQSSKNSWFCGRIAFHRDNGLSGVEVVNINMENQYYKAYYTNVSYYSNFTVLDSTASKDTAIGWRPCTFKYNNVYYGGIEICTNIANHNIIWYETIGNFTPFGVDYYSMSHDSTASSVLNSEINNSISFTQWDETYNQWHVGRATRDIIYNNGSGTKANFSTTTAMSSYDEVEISYRDGNQNYALKRIPGAAGSFVLDIAHPGANNTVYWYISRYIVSGTNVTVGANNTRKAIGASSITTTASQDIYITRITGIRY